MARTPKKPDVPKVPDAETPPKTPARKVGEQAASGTSAAQSAVSAQIDDLAHSIAYVRDLTGQMPDMSDALQKMVNSGVDPSIIVTELRNRGIDVSDQMPAGVTPAAEAPPNNLPPEGQGAVESVNNLPEPGETAPAAPAAPAAAPLPPPVVRAFGVLNRAGMSDADIMGMTPDERVALAITREPDKFPDLSQAAAAATPAATPAAAQAAPMAAPMAAAEPFPSPRHLKELEDAGFDPSSMSPEEMQATYESLVEQGYIQNTAAPAAPEATADEGQQVAAALRTPIMDTIERASDPNNQPGMPPPQREPLPVETDRDRQLRMMAGQSPAEVAYRFLSDAGISDNVLGQMNDDSLIRLAAQLRGPRSPAAPLAGLSATTPAIAPAATPADRLLAGLREIAREAAATVQPQSPAQPSPAPRGAPWPPPSATTPPPTPTSGLTDNTAAAAPVAPSPPPLEVDALEMPRASNPYGSDIYMQLAMAAGMPGGNVQTRFSPGVVGAEPNATPAMQIPQGWESMASDPSVQMNLGSPGAPRDIPQTLDTGAFVPGGVGPSSPPPGPRGPRGGGTRSRVIDALLGRAASGDQPAKLGYISPEWSKMLSSEDGGLLGRVSRFATSPRTLLTAATLKYLAGSEGGLFGEKGVLGEGGVARGVGNKVLFGRGEEEEQQQGDMQQMPGQPYQVRPITSIEEARRRLALPMKMNNGMMQNQEMVPQMDRPAR